ncbi:MAG: hypothetical protein JXA15_08845 [Spirochaetales bacterium]|nr:hypothetical protein [Spirochaetales bacterium]
MSLPPSLVGLLSVLPLAVFLGFRFARVRPWLDAPGKRRFVRLAFASLAGALSLVSLLARFAGTLALSLPFQLLLVAASARLLAPKRSSAEHGVAGAGMEKDDATR